MLTRVSRLTAGATLVALIGVMVAALVHPRSSVSADGLQMTASVTIERVTSIEDMEGPFGGDEDFYAVVAIDGVDRGASEVEENDPDIWPDWRFELDVDASSGTVPIHIEIWESDGGIRGDDDHADIRRGPGNDLDLVLDVTNCAIRGDVVGNCEESLTSRGQGDNATFVQFRIELKEPAFTGELGPRCLVDPIWPQPGEKVTIKLEPYDDENTRHQADRLEIWVDETPGTIDVTAPADSRDNSQLLEYEFTLDTQPDSFAYGCRIVKNGLPAWTGWRFVSVGEAHTVDNAVPISYGGARSGRIDIVFIADSQAFSSSHDPLFLQRGVTAGINTLWRHGIFLRNQDMFNFWISLDGGVADEGGDGNCEHRASKPSWTDSGVIVHNQPADQFTNCAKRSKHLLSTTTQNMLVLPHEIGHTPFGLADERENGAKWETEDAPNVYDDLSGCEADAPNIGRVAEDCRWIPGDWFESWDFWDDNWYTSDPALNDMMVGDSNLADNVWHALDLRRIEWYFDECRGGRC